MNPAVRRSRPARAAGWAIALLLTLPGCAGGPSRGPADVGAYPAEGAAAPAEPDCQATSIPDHPLVTEWPASEKARLESLASRQAVVVAYSGCSLRVLDRCRPPGAYAWRRTTLASELVEVADHDQLWARLPLGAAALEGELGRSGRLAVHTTVAGQLELQAAELAALPADEACAGATHLVTGISVGAFRLVSGGQGVAAGAAAVGGVGAGASSRRSESLMRSAGEPERCAESTDQAPHVECGSPLQLFLRPLGAPAAGPVAAPGAPATAAPGAAAPVTTPRPLPPSAGVTLTFPASEEPRERWALHDAAGLQLCALPCVRTVPPTSGWYLERAPVHGFSRARVELPARLPHPPGSRARAQFQAERGAPTGSAILFYALGLPMGVASVFILGAGIGQVGDPDGHAAPFIVQGTLFLGSGVASWWWWQWSRDAAFVTEATDAPAAAQLRPGPGGLTGQF